MSVKCLLRRIGGLAVPLDVLYTFRLEDLGVCFSFFVALSCMLPLIERPALFALIFADEALQSIDQLCEVAHFLLVQSLLIL